MSAVFSVFSSKNAVLALIISLSLVLAAYSPMTIISHAQSAADLQKLKDMKQKEIDELTRRINALEKTQKSLDVTIEISKNGKAASLTADGSGLNGFVEFPLSAKSKIKDFNQKIIDELTQLKTKAQATTSLDDIQAIGKNVDAQAPLSFMGNIQGSVTNAVEGMTGVLDKVKTTTRNLQGQITKVKACTSSASSVNSSGCDGLNESSADIATAAQRNLDSISTVTSSITSILMSAIALITTLLTTFSSLTNSLGSLGSLDNISSLGNLISGNKLGDINTLTTSLSNFSSLLMPFTSILSQLDVSNLMSGNALGSLTSLTNLIDA